MPKIQVNDVELFYEEMGSGPETILFAHGYLMSSEMYQAQNGGVEANYHRT